MTETSPSPGDQRMYEVKGDRAKTVGWIVSTRNLVTDGHGRFMSGRKCYRRTMQYDVHNSNVSGLPSKICCYHSITANMSNQWIPYLSLDDIEDGSHIRRDMFGPCQYSSGLKTRGDIVIWCVTVLSFFIQNGMYVACHGDETYCFSRNEVKRSQYRNIDTHCKLDRDKNVAHISMMRGWILWFQGLWSRTWGKLKIVPTCKALHCPPYAQISNL